MLVTDVLHSAADLINNSRFKVEIPTALPKVKADINLIGQVLHNLFTNAQKYSLPDSMISICAWQKDCEVVIAVCNQGTEIAPGDLARIFDPFYRAKQQVCVKGVGLGLYITKLFVEAHGGRIWVERKDDRENRFCFSLPVA